MKVRYKQISFWLIMLLIYGCEGKISDRQHSRSSDYISNIDSLYCSEGTQEAMDDFLRGNLIANYTLQDQYGDERFEEILFHDYNIIGVYNSDDVLNKCYKAYMDSIIFLRFGNDIYNIVRRKA